MKEILLDILVDFDKACVANGIHYSIAYGTMLGAIRHKGFIPWDDDIDIIISREDFEKFQTKGVLALKPNHELLTVNKDIRFGAPLPKIIDTETTLKQIGHVSEKIALGVYIDIFIVDRIPENKFSQNIIFKKCFILQKAWSFFGHVPNPKRNAIIQLFQRMANKTNFAYYFAKKLMNIHKSYDNCNSDFGTVLLYNIYGYDKDVLSLKEFNDCITVDFEGCKFKCLKNYNKYLIKHYGNYMELPPVEKRVTHHYFEVYRILDKNDR